MNRPYVKAYDAQGVLINPIHGEFINLQPNRRERRKETVNKDRLFSNKKGLQLIVTKIGWYANMKYKRVLQRLNGKTIVHFKEA